MLEITETVQYELLTINALLYVTSPLGIYIFGAAAYPITMILSNEKVILEESSVSTWRM